MSRKLVLATCVIIVIVGMLWISFRVEKVKAAEPITIKTDGNIEPATANITTSDNITYTFTGNVNNSIVIERSNITIDGNGHTLIGPGNISFAGMHVEGYFATNVTIRHLNILGFETAIAFVSTDHNKVLDCNITGNTYGIRCLESMNDTISGNNITDNDNGIFFNTVFYTAVYANNITYNDNGVVIQFGSGNKFYHNWFVENTNQIYIDPSTPNDWNENYAIGGNYWSDFKSRYPLIENEFSGPNQDILGPDYYWDEPYEIDENNVDYYPIVPEFPSLIVLPLFITATLLAITFRRKKHLIYSHQKKPTAE